MGKLNYIGLTTRPDIFYTAHQVAKYSPDPRIAHAEGIIYIVEQWVTLDFASSQMLQKASNVMGMLTPLEIETASSQPLTLAWPNLEMAGLYFRQPIPLSVPPSYSHKSCIWHFVMSFHSLSLLKK
ncbi:hypothetical protein ACHAW6_000643 [Cyclotella cf. meneghiniana]